MKKPGFGTGSTYSLNGNILTVIDSGDADSIDVLSLSANEMSWRSDYEPGTTQTFIFERVDGSRIAGAVENCTIMQRKRILKCN